MLWLPTQAQMRASPAPGGGSGNSGVQDQNSAATKDFDGFTVSVVRIVKDPSIENGYRLVLSVTDTGDEQRWVALIKPATELIDEMGNVYTAVDSSGIAICTYSKAWDSDLDYCKRYASSDLTKLTPNLPTTLVLYFVPAELNFSKELAELATSASVQSRFGYATETDWSKSDVVINGIQLPQ